MRPNGKARSAAKQAKPYKAGGFVLFTDGGSRGNPGPSAAAFILADPDGRTVHAAGHHLGRATNNVAEYQALVLGLTEALGRGVRELTVCSDSEFMVRQINGQYKVKSPGLKPLYGAATELIARFDRVDVQHVRREQNVPCDTIVNRCLDAGTDVSDAPGPPGGGRSDWPADTFTATCTTDGYEGCPGVVSAGGNWPFDGTTPAGLCVHAAARILAAVGAAKPGARSAIAHCAKPGCSAAFRITFTDARNAR